ncbi:MAG: hypothetical protein KF854_03225 [Nitrospira sp.]|nr:hypothetical protein [Nitrospira sp.]MBX3340940.1 hypothetical protein [Nitrospira sp.]MBX3370160.1 hypothetical protein [Nitrospira sp.]MBX7038123.1 hypothetical protein [Nitrospira sp.]MCW5794265.1 hypothetical protein [Nitrospira sp.]
MSEHKTLYLLRQPISDPAETLLPSAAETQLADRVSLVLLEAAASTTPSFPGPIYVLHQDSATPVQGGSRTQISYRELVTLIAEHPSTIVL